MEKQTQFNLWYFVIVAIAVLSMADAWQQYRQETLTEKELDELLGPALEAEAVPA